MIGSQCLVDVYNDGHFLTVLIRTCWDWCGTLHFMVPPTSVLHYCDLWANYLSADELYANKPPYSVTKHHLQINLKDIFISAFMFRPSIITADTRKEMKRGCWQVEEEKLPGVFECWGAFELWLQITLPSAVTGGHSVDGSQRVRDTCTVSRCCFWNKDWSLKAGASQRDKSNPGREPGLRHQEWIKCSTHVLHGAPLLQF